MRVLNLDAWTKKMIQRGAFVNAIKDFRNKNGDRYGLTEAHRICEAYRDGLIDAGFVFPNPR